MSKLLPIVLLAFLLGGCGAPEVDLEDELRGKEDYELVLLSQPRAGEPGAGSPRDTSSHAAPKPDSTQVAAATPGPGAEEKPSPPVAFDPAGEYTVQIGTYDEARLAGERVKQLSSEGYPAYALANTGNKGARVRIGYFKTREDAERFGRIFKKDKGVDFWIDRRVNEKL